MRSITAFAALAATILATPARAATVEARGSRVTEVTLFADRAEVVREARIDLPAGPSTILFTEVPQAVDPESFRASGRGVPAALGMVEIRPHADEPEETPEYLAARDEVRRIEEALAGLDEASKVASDLREFLVAIRATTAKNQGEALGSGKADPASITAVYTLLETQFDKLGKARIERDRESKKLQEALQVARARLAAARPAGPIRSKHVAVEVEAKQAGALTVRLSYLVPGATWRPTYRASVDMATSKVALVAEATVIQRTGEDWKSVALRLSTAAPARGVEPPWLPPLLLRPQELRMTKAQGGFAEVVEADTRDVPAAPTMVDGEGFADTEARLLQAGIVQSAYNVAFEVPGRIDVPADGSERRVVLREETLDGRLEYRTTPMLNAAAFLSVETKAPGNFPLLSGVVRVFAEGAFLGSFVLPETGPGSELTLPFGVDNRIKVERVRLPQERSREGLSNRTRQVVFAYDTTIENLRDRAVDVVLHDRVPVSEDERIKVETGRETTPGSTPVADRPGVVEWRLSLAPREKRKLRLEYTVRWPTDLYVPDLE